MNPLLSVAANVYVNIRDVKSRCSSPWIAPFYKWRSRNRSHLLIVAVAILMSCAGQASTVVVLRSPEGILAGADSLFNQSGQPAGNICKIHRNDNFFWASTGAYGFSLPNLVSEASGKSMTLVGKMDAFDEIIPSPLSAYLTNLRQNDPAGYEPIAKRQKAVTVIFFGMENGVGSYVADSFLMHVSPKGIITVSRNERNTCPGDKCPQGDSLWVDGERDAIDGYLASHRNDNVGDGDAYIRRLIQLEIADKPKTVGSPINILLVRQGGAIWLPPANSVCPAAE